MYRNALGEFKDSVVVSIYFYSNTPLAHKEVSSKVCRTSDYNLLIKISCVGEGTPWAAAHRRSSTVLIIQSAGRNSCLLTSGEGVTLAILWSLSAGRDECSGQEHGESSGMGDDGLGGLVYG